MEEAYVIIPKEVKTFAQEFLDTYKKMWYMNFRDAADEEGCSIFFNAVLVYNGVFD
jgi:hypothetical protein